MQIGSRGAALIKSYETLRLVAYRPTPTDRWTIGWGHTRGVKEGQGCTREQAETWFIEDTAEAVSYVIKLGIPLSQSMFDALVSLVFNAGAEPLWPNRSIGRYLRARQWYEAWAAFAMWRNEEGVPRRGLARRRATEMALFMEDQLPS